jgi:polyhydroxyalkanoate synthesis regulator protein
MARYLEKSVETFMRQQEGVQAQMAKLMANAPMNAMAEMTRQNLELWTRMQEQMTQAFAGRASDARPADTREEPPAPGSTKPTGTEA